MNNRILCFIHLMTFLLKKKKGQTYKGGFFTPKSSDSQVQSNRFGN